MGVFCFINNREEVPPEAKKLWGDKPITVIGASQFKGRWRYPIIPPSFVKEGGRHTFSLRKCLELEKLGKVKFEEVRSGLLKGIYVK